MPVTQDNIRDVFTYHAPTPEQIEDYAVVREAARNFAEVILARVPPCADQQAAIRLLRESVMTANAAIALKGAV
jgi:hypothetical protein